jgi:polyhydroxybutyrate depolymerase
MNVLKNNFCTLLMLLTLLVSFSACKKDNEKENNNADVEGYRTIERGSSTREYIIHIPTSYNANNPTPLLINFHGFGGTAAGFIGEAGNLNTIANNNNFLVAYPQGVERSKGDAEWDPGDNGSTNINDNDIYFTDQLIADISNEFNVDANKIYASGYSNGGMMAYGLACKKADQIAAVGIMSGTMLADNTCNTNEYTSIINFHGTNDGVLPYNGNQDFQSVPDVVNFWLGHNNIPVASKVSTQLNNGGVDRDVYSGGSGNTAYHLYKVNGGDHIWFTNNIDGQNPNQILWDFLSAYSLND